MRSRRLCGLCLVLLVVGLQPSFLSRLWDHVRDLLPLPGVSEVQPPPNQSSEDTPDLGLGMDPDG